MKFKYLAGVAAIMLVSGFENSAAFARDRIHIVGSSTVYPFSTVVAEHFGQNSAFPVPMVESTGSGGGLNLFCEGAGETTPDITNASRRIRDDEIMTCAANGVTPVEVIVGFDGIVLANSRAGPRFSLTRDQFFLALASRVIIDGVLVANPYVNWSDIDPSLPDERIEVLGPPPTSGTRDALIELVMEATCPEGFDEADCSDIRTDGAYIDAGENDNLIVQKLEANPVTVGIFGFSFLDQNADVLQGAIIDGMEPTSDTIAEGTYPVSRSLYFYVKKEHIDDIPGIAEYVFAFMSDAASGDNGYLAEKGLIPLPPQMRQDARMHAQRELAAD